MFDRLIKYGSDLTGRTPRAELSAAGRWENEGGARPNPAPATTVVVSSPAEQPAPTAAASIALDARQDKIMEIVSSDGRPPSHPRRVLEWRWVGLGAVVLTVGIVAWMLIAGVSLGAIGASLAIGVLLLVGASPVLAAGLLRGKEERTARRIARRERRQSRDR